MATPKLNRLAQRFMQKIQDPILLDGGSPEKFIAGTVIRTVVEIEEYLHAAGMMFFEQRWLSAKPEDSKIGSISHKRNFLNMFPELFKFASVTVTYTAGVSSVDLTTIRYDIFDILDSVKSGGGGVIEIIDQDRLADALSDSDPFLTTPHLTNSNPVMILQQPTLYLFPNEIANPTDYTFTLNYISNIKDPGTGDILRTGGTYDVPYSENNIDAIADVAASLFNKDDFQEDQ